MIAQFNFGVGVDRNGESIPADKRDAALIQIAQYASSSFGGCTIQPGQGYWYDEDDTLIIEPCVTLIVGTNEPLTHTHYKVKWFCAYVKDKLSQSAVCVNLIPSDFNCG
jgi:hypothetical protein